MRCPGATSVCPRSTRRPRPGSQCRAHAPAWVATTASRRAPDARRRRRSPRHPEGAGEQLPDEVVHGLTERAAAQDDDEKCRAPDLKEHVAGDEEPCAPVEGVADRDRHEQAGEHQPDEQQTHRQPVRIEPVRPPKPSSTRRRRPRASGSPSRPRSAGRRARAGGATAARSRRRRRGRRTGARETAILIAAIPNPALRCARGAPSRRRERCQPAPAGLGSPRGWPTVPAKRRGCPVGEASARRWAAWWRACGPARAGCSSCVARRGSARPRCSTTCASARRDVA